jgi:hypothetical protein
MSVDIGIKPVGAPVAAPVVRIVPDGARTAVQTELPPSQTTTAAGDAIATANNPRAQGDQLSRDIEVDKAAAAIVYKVIDTRTGQVVQQFPDEARLKLRAYYRQLDESKAQASNGRIDHKI